MDRKTSIQIPRRFAAVIGSFAGRAALAVTLFAIFAGQAASADVIVRYEFTLGSSTVAPQPASTVAPNVTAGAFAPYLNGALSTSTDGVNGMAFSGFGDNAYLGYGVVDTAVPGNDYWSFTVDANDTYAVDLQTLSFVWHSPTISSGGTVIWDVRSSVDGFASTLGTFSTGVTNSTGGMSVGISSLGTVSDLVEFRIYNYRASGSVLTGSQMRVDDVTINGAVITAAVPAPAALHVGVMLLLGLSARRRPTRELAHVAG